MTSQWGTKEAFKCPILRIESCLSLPQYQTKSGETIWRLCRPHWYRTVIDRTSSRILRRAPCKMCRRHRRTVWSKSARQRGRRMWTQACSHSWRSKRLDRDKCKMVAMARLRIERWSWARRVGNLEWLTSSDCKTNTILSKTTLTMAGRPSPMFHSRSQLIATPNEKSKRGKLQKAPISKTNNSTEVPQIKSVVSFRLEVQTISWTPQVNLKMAHKACMKTLSIHTPTRCTLRPSLDRTCAQMRKVGLSWAGILTRCDNVALILIRVMVQRRLWSRHLTSMSAI